MCFDLSLQHLLYRLMEEVGEEDWAVQYWRGRELNGWSVTYAQSVENKVEGEGV